MYLYEFPKYLSLYAIFIYIIVLYYMSLLFFFFTITKISLFDPLLLSRKAEIITTILQVKRFGLRNIKCLMKIYHSNYKVPVHEKDVNSSKK